jgi:tetratricopeptide (TPR) repeat protein
VSRSEAKVEELLQLVPGVDELELLRLQLMSAAVPDPKTAWDSSRAYATVDKRILTLEDVTQAVAEAEAAVLEHFRLLHEGLLPVFRSYFAGDVHEAASRLIALGERHESSGRARGASQCYRAALSLSLPLQDKRSQILALRRLGRIALALGDFRDATAFYERSAELAADSGYLRDEVIARTGAGNVNMYQGRWPEAEEAYTAALRLAEDSGASDLSLERAQLCNNLGQVHTRAGRLSEAEEWLAKAQESWSHIDSPADKAIWHLNVGHLRERQERLPEARAEYEAGLNLAIPSSLKALIAADFSDVCLLEGYVTEAEDLARISEEHALQSTSPYTLGYMYRHLGNLARARGSEDGFTFFEKALQIAREKGYPSLEAETLTDYAELRSRNGGAGEAVDYLERARELFQQLGSVQDLAKVERALAELREAVRNSAPLPPEPEEPEQPLALSGD